LPRGDPSPHRRRDARIDVVNDSTASTRRSAQAGTADGAQRDAHDGLRAVERPAASAPAATRWGSDLFADLLRALGVEFVALTPGASFRGLHDSLVNHLGNARPSMLLALHEEHAVSIAHGYTRVTGRPMAVALHANVGLMHATMAIFNAWCDRVPMLLLGGVGPMDAVQRRPWVDWIHTARDLGALVRGYTKWDDQPSSVAAAQEAIVRAWQVTQTAPQAPVFVCLDASIQEQVIDPAEAPLPPLARFPVAATAAPPAEAVARAAAALAAARRPLIMVGRGSARREDFDRRVALAERLGARVLTDLKTGARFPTAHPLHPHPAGIFVSGDAVGLVRDADVILSLDWVDLGGALKVACGGAWPSATVIQCSLDPYLHNGWSMDYQSLPPADIAMLADADALVGALLDALPAHTSPTTWRDAPAAQATAPSPNATAATPARADATPGLPIEAMARATVDALAPHRPSYIRLPIGWPGQFCRFDDPLDYIGFDGGGGIGSGPGMAVGAAIALRDTDRLPVAILGDGDYLMGLTALWTAVHYGVPLLVIVANNHSFFNDELHQERTARVRSRPVENRWVGLRMSDPPLDLAALAAGQGAVGFGPVDRAEALADVLADAIAQVRAGAVCVVDVRVAPEYARTVSSALMRHIPREAK
jgi:thiamine pyrophosphate-dependent acetolactate synthase large subunit-like protein